MSTPMNLNCVTREVAEALAKAGWPQDPAAEDACGLWWMSLAQGQWFLGSVGEAEHVTARPGAPHIAVPTLGEMLEECQRRGWGWSIESSEGPLGEVRGRIWAKGEYLAHNYADTPADALGLALAEAMERAKEEGGA